MKKIITFEGLNESHAKTISRFRGKTVKPSDSVTVEFDEPNVVSDKSIEDLLRKIYSCKNGQFNGDLLTFMSENVRPEIREFIKQQLLKVQTPISSHGLSDEDLSALALQQGDTPDSYHERVRTWLESQLPKKEVDK